MPRSVVFPAAHRALLVEEPLPAPGPGQLLLATRLSGISAGTEGMWFSGTATALRSGRKSYPYRPGYELVGEVVSVGEGVTGVAPGERVFAMKPHGSHALVGPADVWFKLPEGLADEDALATALGATALHSIHRSGMTLGDTAAVVGLGTLGLVLTQLLARRIAGHVLCVTTSPDKAAWARMGGAHGVATAPDALPSGTPPIGHAFECSGANPGLARALAVLAPQGVLVGAGFYTEPLVLDGEAFFAKEVTVKAVRATGPAGEPTEHVRRTARSNARLAFAAVAAGEVRLAPFVTHRVRPDELPDAYAMIAGRTEPYGQIVVNWRG